MECKIDLHTHSIISYDGGIKASEYKRALDTGLLQAIAITDHNEIRFALDLREKLGERIIVGEEILSKDGEIIGLFLKNIVSKGLTCEKTIEAIHKQGGIVYIPHPFEIRRKSITPIIAEKIQKDIDIIEIFNGRGLLRNKSKLVQEFVQKNHTLRASSSDAHGGMGLGTAYCKVNELPNSKNLLHLLKNAEYEQRYAPIVSLLFPAMNKLLHRLS